MADARMTPRATYRLQFHAGFTFTDAQAIVPYLAKLGVSHVYASPITAAAPGSTHGYDVIDPTRINPELGGDAGLRALAATLRAHEMGLVIDIVPNHMGVAGDSNPWWLDVLANGRASEFARVFDIDWRERIALPVLGARLDDVIAAGDVRLKERDGTVALDLYGSLTYPLRPDDPTLGEDGARAIASHDPGSEAGRAALAGLLDRQHYRLVYWPAADDTLNWRRFFAINELVGVRVEDPDVFELTHRLYCDLLRQGLIDGVRIDHVDGLVDPARYCRQLRGSLEHASSGDRPYIVVEKILATGEPLALDWGIDGTTGYDFMREVTALIHEPEGIAPLGDFWAQTSGRPADFAPEAEGARRDILNWHFDGQLTGCVDSFAALAAATGEDWITPAMLRRAMERLLWVFPVYRTYGDGETAPASDEPVRLRAIAAALPSAPPGEGALLERIGGWLAGEGRDHITLSREAVRRFQQLSAPIAAKGVEDTAFYRYGALLSLNDVGFDPAVPTLTIGQFHAAMACRATDWPRAMLATATHDHKRGEDARARLAVLSAIPGLWRTTARRWLAMAAAAVPEVDPADAYMLLQALVGAWQDTPDELLPRIHGWQVKALREAQLRSSWAAPAEDYEARFMTLSTVLLADRRQGGFVDDFGAFIGQIAAAAEANSLAQTALRCLLPGVPDLYQGAELADFGMVDPDNRRPVDFAARAALLDQRAGREFPKLRLLTGLLGLRREHPRLFERGDYVPLRCEGRRAGNMLAFRRVHEDQTITCAIALRLGAELVATGLPIPSAEFWEGTTLAIDGEHRAASELFRDLPVWVA
jgi:(1->4)-alpha-D-glucan 1-alpha-D-glucosylmutase